MLVVGDSGAQRSFFRTFDFDSFGTMQFGPPLMELCWYDLESHVRGAVLVDKIKRWVK